MEEEAPQRQLRSVPGTEAVHIRFFNFTSNIVEIIWFDYNGTYKSYGLLRKGESWKFKTYINHPWFAIDYKTKQRLLIDKSFVYYPKTPLEYIRDRGINVDPGRIDPMAAVPVHITLPLYTLRYTTLLMLSQFFQTVESIDVLELPKELKDDLKKIITQRINNGEVLPR